MVADVANKKARTAAVRLNADDQEAVRKILARRLAFTTSGALRYALHRTVDSLEAAA